MSFSDIIQDDFLAMTELHEAIEYKEASSDGAKEWRAIEKAIVQRGDDLDDLVIGQLHESGARPIRLQVVKHATLGVLEVSVKYDRVKLDPGTAAEKVYRIVASFNPGNPSIWFLYAAP